MANDIELIGVMPAKQPIDLSQAHSLQDGAIDTDAGRFQWKSAADGLPDDFFTSDIGYERGSFEGNRVEFLNQLKTTLVDILNSQTQVLDSCLKTYRTDMEDRLKQLTANINAAFNDLDERVTGIGQQVNVLETALGSFIRMVLVGEKMSDEERTEHQNVLTNFLQATAVLTLATPAANETEEAQSKG